MNRNARPLPEHSETVRKESARVSFSSRAIKVETAVAGVCLASSTLLIFLAAVARSFSRPINWSLDISLFLFAWAAFLSADVAYRFDKLVNVDAISSKFTGAGAFAVKLGIYTLILAFLVVLAVFGVILAWKSRQRAFQGIPGISYSWVTLSMPVGALLMLQTTVDKIIALFKNRD